MFTPSRNPAVERQRPHKGIQHHFLALAGIGDDKRLATVAQAEVGNLHRSLDTAQDNAFFAPVKLEGITGSKMQGNECLFRSGVGVLEISDNETLSAIGPRTMVEC